MTRKALTAVAVSALILTIPALATASTITWGAATTISGDADVQTGGTLVGAFNLGGAGVASTSVNGVLFSALAVSGNSATSGDFTLTNAGGFFENNTTGFGAAFSGLSANYQHLLNSVIGQPDGDASASVLTINGLAPGGVYQFEWWSNSQIDTVGGEVTTGTAGNSVNLLANTASLLGQFAIGTFTAAGTGIETISFAEGPNSPDSFLNGFELREISAPAAVPEPTTLALLGTGLVGLAARRRRNRR